VLSTTLSYLTIYRDPVVANNVSRSDFHIRDLMHSEEPVTLYIVTEPVDKQCSKVLFVWHIFVPYLNCFTVGK
jgi:type IV secretory pathway TraG/TraD family ATPase VirD4